MADLSALIERHMLRAFAWGEADCCLAPCNVWRDGGWRDPAVPYRGRYSDEAGARVVMAGTVEDVAEREFARLGWPEIDPAEARDWDAGVRVLGNSLLIRCEDWWNGKSLEGKVMLRKVDRAWRAQ